jgi:hypothetical protein
VAFGSMVTTLTVLSVCSSSSILPLLLMRYSSACASGYSFALFETPKWAVAMTCRLVRGVQTFAIAFVSSFSMILGAIWINPWGCTVSNLSTPWLCHCLLVVLYK